METQLTKWRYIEAGDLNSLGQIVAVDLEKEDIYFTFLSGERVYIKHGMETKQQPKPRYIDAGDLSGLGQIVAVELGEEDIYFTLLSGEQVYIKHGMEKRIH